MTWCRTDRERRLPSPTPLRDWPNGAWSQTSPEAQGMSSAQLVDMMEALQAKGIVLDSLTIVRNGHMVADLYPNPMFPHGRPHVINSCAKSVMSILVGIAIDRGAISGPEARLIDLLGIDERGLDARWTRLTLDHLLSMQTGLRSRDSFLYRWEGLFAMTSTEDWVAHVLTLPFDAEPGTRFDYSNISTYLLSAILTRATGTSALTFAKEHLFGPLGIDGVRWETDSRGTNVGFARMWMQPRDMAKLGLLYLQHGRWADRQVVSEQWVRHSLQVHGRPRKYVYIRKANGRPDYITSGGYWLFTNLARPFSEGYGYQWWLGKKGTYAAIGVNGQFIMVAPEQNLVVSATNKFAGRLAMLPAMLLFKRILPAVVSDEAVEEDPEAFEALQRWSQPPAPQEERTEVVLPVPRSEDVAGLVFLAADNPWNYDAFTFDFAPEASAATVSFTKDGEPAVFQAGLDGLRRYSTCNDDIYAARAHWSDPTTLEVEFEVIGYSSPTRWTFTFDDATHAAVTESSVIGTNTYTVAAARAARH